ncbi:MAG: class I SAM-dependent methyltransferase [Desulfuromonas thiophila]|nr:class I SAM-dependent methyltransferase [Desulfuromonas thiophila]MDD3800650.1 class I SAM-dependent methyltransferase [Desulfuromonas thiophila]
MGTQTVADRYRQTCQRPFWQQVLAFETDYLRQYLSRQDTILSIGCGPALIEQALARQGFSLTGLDIAAEALASVPPSVPTVLAPAEALPFDAEQFDVVLFLVSLQFVNNPQQAIAEAARVLRPAGRLIVLLLNPASAFYKTRVATAGSYVQRIRHPDPVTLQTRIAQDFRVQAEYLLGIAEERVFPSSDPAEAAIYALRGHKRRPGG